MVDVEFIAQYLQLKYGKDKPKLHIRNTIDALHVLHDEKLLSTPDYETVVNGYKFLRRVENKLRLIHDQSVNALTADPARLTELAMHLGYPTSSTTAAQLLLDEYAERTQAIREVFDRLLNPAESG